MKELHIVTYVLVIIGALNWGLVGLLDFNLVTTLLGVGSVFSNLVYVLVGVSAVVEIAMHKDFCKMCGTKKK